MFFTQKTWKVKIITHDLNHGLIFYCSQINCVCHSRFSDNLQIPNQITIFLKFYFRLHTKMAMDLGYQAYLCHVQGTYPLFEIIKKPLKTDRGGWKVSGIDNNIRFLIRRIEWQSTHRYARNQCLSTSRLPLL